MKCQVPIGYFTGLLLDETKTLEGRVIFNL